MAKEINLVNLESGNEQFTSNKSNILYREHLEYTGSRIFWGATIGLAAVTIYASLVCLVVQQLKK